MARQLTKRLVYLEKENILNGCWKCYTFFVPSCWLLYRSIFLISIFLISITSIHASGDPSLKAWIDFIEEDKTAFVKGLFLNSSDQPKSLDWEMTIFKGAPIVIGKKPDESFTGSFVAQPLEPQLIAEVEVDLKKREYFVIVFNVFDKKKDLVGTDTLTSEKIDPTLKPLPPPTPPIATQDLAKPSMNPDAIEIDGLILDETRTKVGRDFYEFFYNKWIPPQGTSDFLITVKELPSRGIGARVSIEVNNNVVLYRFLQPRNDIVEEQANISISAVQRYLQQNESLKKSIDSEDTMGSGIY